MKPPSTPTFIALAIAFLGLQTLLPAKGLKPVELTPEWKEMIREIAPESPAAQPKKDRKILIFSLATGYVHWCIPHTDAVVEILGEKSGAYQTTRSTDIEVFLPESLKQYDAVVLNNTCPDRKDRDMFRDVLINKMDKFGEKYKSKSPEEREALATKLYRSLVDYVAEGGGLVLLHGAITSFNNSDEFSALVGGSFDYHPPQQDVTLIPVIPDHPLLKPFKGEPFTHYDEPYIMKRAYDQFNFHPLLEMETDSLKVKRPDQLNEIQSLPRYVSWIKPAQKGRIFFCSPSHNAQSFERPELLAYILNGVQYTLGDLDCDDSPKSLRTK